MEDSTKAAHTAPQGSVVCHSALGAGVWAQPQAASVTLVAGGSFLQRQAPSFGVRRPGFESQLHHLYTVTLGPWVNHFLLYTLGGLHRWPVGEDPSSDST